jgi:hypothetical protein
MIEFNKILDAFRMRNWFAVAALALMIVLQVIRQNKVPGLTKLWFKVPDGWRWIGPVLIGAATAFTTAFAQGVDFAHALLAVVGGLLGISLPSMGWHAVAKESPVHIDGGAGGKPIEPQIPA